jgi:hypothetical protein
MDSLPDELWATIACFMGAGESGDLIRRRLTYGIRHRDRKGRTYVNGLRHSWDDQPAVVYHTGHAWHKMWYQQGQIHRDNDLAAVIWSDGTHGWFKRGMCYRVGWPAVPVLGTLD